jgi:NADPH-dependent curcumin reductase CurA
VQYFSLDPYMRERMDDRESYQPPIPLGDVMRGESVAAASGPVGSLVGQLAKLASARAVGIAGGPEKCASSESSSSEYREDQGNDSDDTGDIQER